jgi:hypothetical protein
MGGSVEGCGTIWAFGAADNLLVDRQRIPSCRMAMRDAHARRNDGIRNDYVFHRYVEHA